MFETRPDNAARRVVFVECAAAMGGVQFSTLYLAQALNRARWKAIVVCPEKGDLTRACRETGVEVHVVPQPRSWSTSVRVGNKRVPNPFAWLRNLLILAGASRRLEKFFRGCSPDIVVTKGLLSHFTGAIASRRSKIVCVWHVQDLISERSFGIYRRLFKFAARRLPNQIIVDGAAIARQLPRPVRSRTTVVHNGVDINEFRPGLDGAAVRAELGIPEDCLVIGHAGRITPWKGQHYLIEAFARIAHDCPETTLLFAGSPVFDNDTYERRLKTMAAEFGLTDRIKFAGYRHDLPRVLAAMDVFAFTSVEKDTSPLALLSAMAAGLPIVGFDIDGVRELIDSEDQVLRVAVGNTEQLATALAKLITDGALRSRMAQTVRQLAERKYSLEKHVSAVESVLNRAEPEGLKSAATDAEELAHAAEMPANSL